MPEAIRLGVGPLPHLAIELRKKAVPGADAVNWAEGNMVRRASASL